MQPFLGGSVCGCVRSLRGFAAYVSIRQHTWLHTSAYVC
jgi:hypothetical protein